MTVWTTRRPALLAIALALAGTPAVAQYKWQTPEGTTAYSDVPPIGGAMRMNERAPVARSADGPAERVVELPYALKQAAARQPVVLYSASDCQPCQLAREHLVKRGIPFGERTITTVADFEALKGLGFTNNGFPALTIGRERTVGFESGTWDRLLTAAGYPRESQLPPGYRQAAAEPLTSPQPQQMTVNVQRETAATEGMPTAMPAQQRAIDAYRAQLQAGQPKAPDTPAMRF